MSKKLSELDEAVSLNDTDDLYVVQGGVSKKVPKSLLGGSGAGLIAAWNGTDLTQLVSTGSPDFTVGGSGRTLSVASVSERGNVLRYSGGAAGATITEIFMFTAASGLLIPSTTERRDVDIEVEVYTSSGAGGYFGVFVMGDADTPLHGFGHSASGPSSEWQMLLNNGTVAAETSTGSASTRFTTYRIRGRKPVGAPPEISSYSSGQSTAADSVGEPRRSGSDATARGTVSQFGDSTTLGSTWNNISADRIGLVFQSSGGNPAPLVDILGVRVIQPF